MQFLPRWLAVVFLAGNLSPVQAAFKTEARLVLSAEAARPGDTVLAGVQLRMAPRWHTYWKNPGESGMATQIKWQLPAGVTAGEILWPIPEKVVTGGLTTYAYHDEAVLLVLLIVAKDAPAGRFDLSAKVSWLECEEVCVPGSAELKATLVIGNEIKPSSQTKSFETWRTRLPRTGAGFDAAARWEKDLSADSRSFSVELPAGGDFAGADFFPFASENFEVLPATEKVAAGEGRLAIRKVVKKMEGNWPDQLAGLLVNKLDARPTAAYEVSLALGDTPSAGGLGPKKSLPAMLLLAFLGGLILNIMPCVLPVIALKILGFVQQSREAPAQVRKLGLIYLAGVLCSFLVLAGAVIGVQQAGKLASWGMQFGNAKFLVAMIVLVTLVALNLFGLFEITLSGRAMGAASDLAGKEGGAGAFFNGVLATALATPCTAPFLAPALGYAFIQPPTVILLFFLTVGFGLALPYVILCWEPAWLKFLPKPGAWMEKFKIAMGFPMLATAVWLAFDVGAAHFGKKVFWLGVFLVTLALSAWIWGEFVQRGRKRKGLAAVVSLLVLAAGYGYALESELHWRSPAKLDAANNSLNNDPGGIQWQPWSAEAVAKARAEGRPVFVDFTADWCVTCQANKKTSIEIPSVRAKLKEINAVALLGDNTLVPDTITEELKRFDRAGVPLVLVYPRDASKPPIVLPELLTPRIVLDALERAAR